jgi:hypothetical protein
VGVVTKTVKKQSDPSSGRCTVPIGWDYGFLVCLL